MTKTILITGSNRGIGFEIARQLGSAGHHVILSGRDSAHLNDSVSALGKEKINASGLFMDVSNNSSIQRAAGELNRMDFQIDVLINNAAILLKQDKNLLRDDFELLEKTIRVNSFGALKVIRELLPLINRPGRIINISSEGGSISDHVGGWSPAYCVSKTLLNAITRQLADQLSGENISVNAVCPGWVKTRMGGKSATRHVEKGAETPVWLAIEAPQNLTGKFFRDKQQIEW